MTDTFELFYANSAHVPLMEIHYGALNILPTIVARGQGGTPMIESIVVEIIGLMRNGHY